jgi:hypothetical protein
VSEVTYSQVRRRASALGLYLTSLGDHKHDDGHWFLTATTNWQTTQPGRTLRDTSEELDRRAPQLDAEAR